MKANVRKQIHRFDWYQTIEFEPGVTSNGCKWCGDPAWNNIKGLIPKDLNGMRILDLGCNAGIFCVRSAQIGAQEVIGIESNTWRKEANYLKQAKFVKEFFEEKDGKSYPIDYREGRMEDLLEDPRLGIFDYCYAIASLYYTNDPEKVVRLIGQKCKRLVVRIRDESRIKQLTGYFEKYKFLLLNEMRENWSEKLGHPADDFYLYYYDTLLQV